MEESSELIGLLTGSFTIAFLFIGVIIIIARWKIYEKAGKPGWASIIPIYDNIVLLEIVGKPIWWLVMLFIPLVNIVFVILMFNALAKSFGKGSGFTVGLIFLPFIFFPILGFGDAQYLGPVVD